MTIEDKTTTERAQPLAVRATAKKTAAVKLSLIHISEPTRPY